MSTTSRIETYGMEPVPARLKTVRWQDLFCIIINFQLNAGQILVSGLSVAAGLPVWQAILAQTLGIALAFIPYVAMATVGVDYGIPGQTATRMAFGLRGARLVPSLLRTAASIYWFAFQTIAGSLAITAVLDRWTHSAHSLLAISLGFGALQALVAIFGYGSLKILSRVALPLKLILLAWMLFTLMTYPDPHFRPGAVLAYRGHGGGWMLFVAWLSSWVATWLTMITDAADFCRYSRSRRDMWIGTMLAAVVGALCVSVLGAYAAGASLGAQPSTFALVASISQGSLALLLLVVVILFDNWTINVLNLYTGGLSLLNMAGGLGRLRATILVSVIGIALSAFPGFVNRYTGWMELLGTCFAPLAGVLLAEYLVIRRMRLEVAALFTPQGAYWYWGGYNPVAIGWTVIGFILYRFVLPESLPVPVVVVLLTGAGHVVTTRLIARLRRRPARLGTPLLDDALLAAAFQALERLRRGGLTAVTAESCTGGLVAASLTHHAGSSDVVLGGFVTYSNPMKHTLLGVPMALFEQVGAVSEAVARAMAEGALARSGAACAVSITGIAGPGGGSADKPVGLVWIASVRRAHPSRAVRHVFAGSREAVRSQAGIMALGLLG